MCFQHIVHCFLNQINDNKMYLLFTTIAVPVSSKFIYSTKIAYGNNHNINKFLLCTGKLLLSINMICNFTYAVTTTQIYRPNFEYLFSKINRKQTITQ